MTYKDIKNNFKLDINGDHGSKHWKNVYRNCIELAKANNVDKKFNKFFLYFAYLHDTCRTSEYHDNDHGEAASDYYGIYHRKDIKLDDERFNLLLEAICNHSTKTYKSNSILVKICLDADRLDLTRINVIPDPRYLQTKTARKIAREMSK